MQEESNMDKKLLVKPSQGKLGNGDTSNTKCYKPGPPQNQQEFGGSKYNRQNRRRDNGFQPRHDGRRPYKGQDKRPFSRADNSIEKSRQVGDVKFEAISDVPLTKGKKQNLNHLLNFTIAPRRTEEYGAPARRAGLYTRRPKYNKEQYLQANCQFVVRAEGDYTVYTSDPDLLVNWDFIEQIRVHSNEIPSCPICLYPPKAAKITRCGHIYCSSCILHYLALSDKPWRKCPICYESVNKKDIKSVLSISHPQLSSGDDVTFCLMRRERNAMIAVPVEQYKEGITYALPTLEGGPTAAYSKLLLASPDQVIKTIIERERNELELQLKEERDEPESCFIQHALELLKEREQDLKLIHVPILEEPMMEVEDSLQNLSITSDPPHAVIEYESAFEDLVISPEILDEAAGEAIEELPLDSEGERQASEGADQGASGVSEEPEVTPEDLDISKLQKPSNPNQPKTTFYFYQAIDGQQLFLHALNVHMLVAEYGSLERCPRMLTGKVIELEGTGMTESLRSKLRYLSHLPVTANFQVAEIQLKPPQISSKTVNMFRDEVEKRRRNRARRARSEKKREKRIYQEEIKKWGSYPFSTANIQSHYHFPQKEAVIIESNENTMEVISTSPDDTNAPVDPSAPKSFAQMLREGKIKSSEEAAAWGGTAAWGAAPLPTKLPEGKKRNTSEESEADEWVPPPEYQESFSISIADAIKNVSDSQPTEDNSSNCGKKKKKKGKQQLLFSTSMARGK